jgi:hypothetical protein
LPARLRGFAALHKSAQRQISLGGDMLAAIRVHLSIIPPSVPGDHIRFAAKMDLIVGLTARSALQSTGGDFKPIDWAVD